MKPNTNLEIGSLETGDQDQSMITQGLETGDQDQSMDTQELPGDGSYPKTPLYQGYPWEPCPRPRDPFPSILVETPECTIEVCCVNRWVTGMYRFKQPKRRLKRKVRIYECDLDQIKSSPAPYPVIARPFNTSMPMTAVPVYSG